MNGYKKLTAMVLGVLILGAFTLTAFAAEPANIKRSPLRVNGTGFMTKYLVKNGTVQGVNGWTGIDSAGVDTSEAYEIVPGCLVNVTLKTDAAADSIYGCRIYGSQDRSNWIIIDSLLNITSVIKSRNLIGTAAAAPLLTVGQPVMFRWVRCILTAQIGTALADTVNVSGYITTSPTMND